MKTIFLISLVLIIECIYIDPLRAQIQNLSDDSSISLLTILPGESPEEFFGHSALRVKDPQTNLDISFNYGTFQFDSFFIFKFMYGDLDYFLSIANYPNTFVKYREQQRPIIEQVLNLSHRKKQELFELLIVNSQIENRYYDYNFISDNCSTRIWNVFEILFAEHLRLNAKSFPELTFREMIEMHLDNKPLINLGVNLLLGSKVDKIAQPREMIFLPNYLMQAFNQATVSDGNVVEPLVSRTDTLLYIDDYSKKKESLPLGTFLIWGVFLIGIFLTFEKNKSRGLRVRMFDAFLFTSIGLIGILIVFFWFLSLHEVTNNNLNLFWAWPTHLFIVPTLFRNFTNEKKIYLYHLLSASSCFFLLVGWTFWFQNLNPTIIPILLLLIVRSIALIKKSYNSVKNA